MPLTSGRDLTLCTGSLQLGSNPAGRYMKSQVRAYVAVADMSSHDVFFALRAIRVPERLCFLSAADAFLPT